MGLKNLFNRLTGSRAGLDAGHKLGDEAKKVFDRATAEQAEALKDGEDAIAVLSSELPVGPTESEVRVVPELERLKAVVDQEEAEKEREIQVELDRLKTEIEAKRGNTGDAEETDSPELANVRRMMNTKE